MERFILSRDTVKFRTHTQCDSLTLDGRDRGETPVYIEATIELRFVIDLALSVYSQLSSPLNPFTVLLGSSRRSHQMLSSPGI